MRYQTALCPVNKNYYILYSIFCQLVFYHFSGEYALQLVKFVCYNEAAYKEKLVILLMNIPIYIISGFLGAGKTTCIQHLIAQLDKKERVMIVENDFGEVSFDATVLKKQGMHVRELTSGCICCSLSGDFKTSLKEVLATQDVDIIFIEPSGVGKASEIRMACQSKELSDLVTVKGCITIIDIQTCALYARNFGEFYEDQLHSGDIIICSHVEQNREALGEALAVIKKYNSSAYIYQEPWDEIPWQTVLHLGQAASVEVPITLETAPCHEYDHIHDEHISFSSYTWHARQARTAEEWRRYIEAHMQQMPEVCVRMKGILPTPDGHIEIQYNGTNIVIKPIDIKENFLTCIGKKLSEKQWKEVWQEG